MPKDSLADRKWCQNRKGLYTLCVSKHTWSGCFFLPSQQQQQTEDKVCSDQQGRWTLSRNKETFRFFFLNNNSPSCCWLVDKRKEWMTPFQSGALRPELLLLSLRLFRRKPIGGGRHVSSNSSCKTQSLLAATLQTDDSVTHLAKQLLGRIYVILLAIKTLKHKDSQKRETRRYFFFFLSVWLLSSYTLWLWKKRIW